MQEIYRYNVLLAGCGIGQSAPVAEFIQTLVTQPGLPVMVLDADALNILARIPEWHRKLTGKNILTPHPREMARLTGTEIDSVQSNRLRVARRTSEDWGEIVVLKGAYTVIAEPGGHAFINPFANPGLASAGTGDVLTGVIAAFAAQGLYPFEAAAMGVYIHGKAGEQVRTKLGDTGMIASDLIPELPVAINNTKNSR
jgi:NAD(P)H-hydrate epimerase